jgi:flavodoxin
MKLLIVYYSRADENWFKGGIKTVEVGNTAIVAGIIKNITGFDTHEIKPVKPYPINYQECCSVASQEIKNKVCVPIEKDSLLMDDYEGIILGYPIWCGTFPSPVRTFLTSHNMIGKDIYPFSTSEGSNLGISIADLGKTCPSSIVHNGLPIIGSDAHLSEPDLRIWLKGNNII